MLLAGLVNEQLECGGEAFGLQPHTLSQLACMVGTGNGALCFLCLALGRYWQAALYNPGGFGSEFRDLQLPRAWVWGLVVAALGFTAAGLAFRSWGAAMLLPLTIAGFALLHSRAKFRQQGSFWISGTYVVWIVFDAAKLALVGLVLADTAMNFRKRWADASVDATPHDDGAQNDASAASDEETEKNVSDDDDSKGTKD